MKKSTQYSIYSILVFTSLLPIFTFASKNVEVKEKTQDTQKPISIPQSNNFCSNFEKIKSKLTESIAIKEQKNKENEIKLTEKTIQKESDVDAKRAKGRIDTDSKRIKTADKLNTKAKTDSQKIAVSNYTKAIDTAVAIRRSEIDAATKAYKEGLAKISAESPAETNTTLESLKANIQIAIEKASTDCANKVPNKTVSTIFNKSIKDAKLKFNNTKALLTQSADLKNLKENRDSAFKKAEVEFKNATDKARADLIMSMK